MEILPGIHRIESDLGVRFMCQYLLTGEDHTVLVDTGLAGTPEEVIIPYLEGVGLSLEDIDEVIISHADVDHCGGNRALKEMHPALWFTCGEPDRAYVENNEVMTAETLSALYRTPVEVLRVRDRIVVVGADQNGAAVHHHVEAKG